MNREALRQAHPHVREEFAKREELNGILEKALGLAVSVIREEGDPALLEGAPPRDADPGEWLDYFIRLGAMVVYAERTG